MKKIFFIALSATLVLISGCEKVIEPKDLPDQEPRIVLNSIIYTGRQIEVTVSSSKSIISGKDYRMIENAACDLYVDDKFAERLTGGKKGIYLGSTVPMAGARYTLKVSAAGFPDVEAGTSVPPAVSITSIERYDTVNSRYVKMIYPHGYTQIMGATRHRLLLRDDPAVNNYYSLTINAAVYDSAGNQMDVVVNPYLTPINAFDNVISSGVTIETDDRMLVNGKDILVDFDAGFYSSSGDVVAASSALVLLTIDNISEDLYRYKLTLNQQASTGANLFAEPVIVYTNVKNGMGIFAAVNSSTQLLYNGPIWRQ